MKNSNTCPKCGTRDIVVVPASELKTKSNIIPIGLTMAGCIGLTRYICCQCGFTEEWIDAKDDIERVRAKFPSNGPSKQAKLMADDPFNTRAGEGN